MKPADERYRDFLAACVREADRRHTPEQVAAAAAILAAPTRPAQPQLDLQWREAA